MAMKPKCRAAVRAAAQAVGREGVTDAEIDQIDARLQRTMRLLARTDEQWQTYSWDMRTSLAAERAIADIRAEAARKVANAQRQIVKTAALEERLRSITERPRADGAPPISRSHALAEEMDQTRTLVEAETVQALGRMMDLLDAVKSGDGVRPGRRLAMLLFDADNPAMTRDLAREAFLNADGRTGNEAARLGAKAWLKVIEDMRQRFNNAGGDVGRLEYGYLPQPHDAARVRAVGADAFAAKTLALVDRSRYLLEDGARMSDAQVAEVLRAAWDTIQSEGLNKRAPGAIEGQAARANRGSDPRVIHFRDGDAWLTYMAEFGRGNMYDAMHAHVAGMARSITLVERYGPNPAAQMRLQLDLAARADGRLQKLGVGAGEFRVDPRGMWETLNGSASTPAQEYWAAAGQMVRNVQVMGKLAGTVIKSLPDLATYFITTGFNRLPYWEAIANLGRVATDARTREFLGMHGLMATAAAEALNRFSAETVAQGWSGRLANSTMRLSLMTKWDDWLNRAFGMTKMHGLGNMAGLKWEALTEWDRALLERRGIGAADWAVVNRAAVQDFKGMKFLTPDSIVDTGDARGVEIATKVLALIRDESQYAVVKPDIATQAARTWNGTQAGTGLGELARSVMLFKSFPLAMVTRHWRRMLDMPAVGDGSAPVLANRLMYGGALVVGTTALGAISMQAWQLLQGKDPIDMTGEHALKFWAQAFATGGGAGFYADLIGRDSTSDRGAWDSVGRTLGGPVVGDAADLYALTKGNIDQAIAGKATHAGAEAVRFTRSHMPFINLWYAKAAVDHAGLHALQENLSPGYLGKIQKRASKDWGQAYWWAPTSATPARAPDIAKAVGQ